MFEVISNNLCPLVLWETDTSISERCGIAGLLLPAVVRPILDSYGTSKEGPKTCMSDVSDFVVLGTFTSVLCRVLHKYWYRRSTARTSFMDHSDSPVINLPCFELLANSAHTHTHTEIYYIYIV